MFAFIISSLDHDVFMYNNVAEKQTCWLELTNVGDSDIKCEIF